MRLKNQELLRATRPSHAVTYASCQGLTLHNRVRLDLESATSRCATCTWAPRGPRAAGSLERAARRLQGLQHEVAHLEEHAPLPGHQPHVPDLHKRAVSAARKLRGARHAVAGGVPDTPSPPCTSRACPWLTLTARCSWLSSSVRVTPGKGFWKMIMSSMTACSTPSVHSSRSLGPVVLDAGLPQHLHVRLVHQRARG